MNKKGKKKIYPYTQESLGRKSKLINFLLSAMESVLILPILDICLKILSIEMNKILLLILLYFLFLILLYSFKLKNKKYDFSQLQFLDDEISILTDRRLDGEVKDFMVNKCIALIGLNIIIVVPFSLTFSSILASVLSLIFAFFLEETFVNLIKFILIVIIFKHFFKPSNDILIKYLDDKKELY